MAVSPLNSARYGKKLLQVEPYGIDVVLNAERHGSPRSQFTLWLGSNLSIGSFALGALPIALGLPWSYTLIAIIVGNLLGGLLVGACAAMGPTYGLPQLMIGRYSFGRVGGYLPALLNYISTIGWFTVNNILGAFGLRILFPELSYLQAALLLVIVQGLLAIYGHNLIHLYERIMAIVLATVFLIGSIVALTHFPTLTTYHPHTESLWSMFAIMLASAFSYVGSWGPYASDYSRYLAQGTSRKSIMTNAFWGSFIASAWLELVGVAVSILAGSGSPNIIVSLHSVMGGFGVIAVIAVVLGGTAADALNVYSNALSAGALGIRLPRFVLTVLASIIGLILSLIGSGQFESNYENFLLVLGYWLTPWVAVLLVDFYVLKRYNTAEVDARNKHAVYWPGVISFVVGFVVSIPFMSAQIYTGPVAQWLHGADLTFYVGFLVAGVLYYVLSKRNSAVEI